MKERENNVRCLEHKCFATECDHGGHYNIYSTNSVEDIKRIFPEGEANDLNWLIGSTSGIHGTYNSLDLIEGYLKEGETEKYYSNELTFLIIMPRLVSLTYGCVEITNQEDVDYFRKLITSSVKFIQQTQEYNLSHHYQ